MTKKETLYEINKIIIQYKKRELQLAEISERMNEVFLDDSSQDELYLIETEEDLISSFLEDLEEIVRIIKE